MPHEEKHLKNSNFITDVVIGMSDGLTVPFALAAGLSGAVSTNTLVITAGIAELVAGGISMGLGGFLAGQTEVDHYNAEEKREYAEVETMPDKEKEEVKEVFASFGLSPEIQEAAANELALDKDKWVAFMMKNELGLERPEHNRARNSAITIGGAYVMAGFIPLSSYIFTKTPKDGLIVSVILTTISLFVFGYFKGKATGQKPINSALKVTLIGLVAAAAAYFVAGYFDKLI